MNYLFYLIIFMIVFPNTVMSIQTIITNHLLMATCDLIRWKQGWTILYRFDSKFTVIYGFGYCGSFRRKLSEHQIFGALVQFWIYVDDKASRFVWNLFKPLLVTKEDLNEKKTK